MATWTCAHCGSSKLKERKATVGLRYECPQGHISKASELAKMENGLTLPQEALDGWVKSQLMAWAGK